VLSEATYLIQSDLLVGQVVLFLFVQPLPVLYLVQGHLLFDSSTNGPNIRNVAESVDSEALVGSFLGIFRIGRLNWLLGVHACYLLTLQVILQREFSCSSVVDALQLS